MSESIDRIIDFLILQTILKNLQNVQAQIPQEILDFINSLMQTNIRIEEIRAISIETGVQMFNPVINELKQNVQVLAELFNPSIETVINVNVIASIEGVSQ